MSDYIKRSEAIDIYKPYTDRGLKVPVENIISNLEGLPSADVVERKRGSYTNTKDDYEWYARMHTCDLCGKSWMGDTNFCPNCGADMRGKDED